MQKIAKKEKGITLIALIITIIVLLILAGISIATLTGENGILTKASTAKEEMKRAEYAEELKIIGLGLQPDRTTKNWNNQKYMNEYQREIEKDDMFLNAKEIKQLPNTEKITIQVITIEGWVYWITEDKVEYKGTEEEQQPQEPEEPVVEPTGIYASLVGNTLKFYTTKESAEASGGEVYENVQGKTFTRDNTDGVEAPTTPWFSDKNQITSVEFVDEVAPEYMAYFFSDLDKLETVNMEKVKTINVNNMYGMFLNCRSLKEINTKGFDTRNVENMGWMFLNCSSLTNLDLTMFNTSKVTNMEVMFNGCSALTQLDVSGFDTSNVTTMRSMFANMTSLLELDVSNFITSNVTDMKNMFYKCTNLEELDLSSFDTSKVTDMFQMFNTCTNLTKINLSSFDTSSVNAMRGVFANCGSLTVLDLSSFDTSKVTTMQGMFAYDRNLETVYVGEKWVLAEECPNMFLGCKTSTTTRK